MVDEAGDGRPPIRVLVVDDHTMFAESVARLFNREPDIVVADIAVTSTGAVAVAAWSHPDVAVVDYGLPDADGIQTAVGIRAVSPGTRVIILTGQSGDGVATAAIQAGCSGFLTKDQAAHELVVAVRLVNAGKAYIGPNHLLDLQQGLALEKMKREFVARIGHELRTPLTAVLGYGRMLSRPDIAADRVRQVGLQIVDSGERLERIVELLEVSASSGGGRLTVHASFVDTGAVIDDAVSRSAAREDWTHKFQHETPDLPVLVMADRRWLTMALDELIDNAVKFSPQGGTITVSVIEDQQVNARTVQISVSDQGIGMSPALQQIVFEEFVQADSSDTRPFGGLGLGLSLVRQVALAHGWTVSCNSSRPGGTTMSIVISDASPSPELRP